MHSHTILEVADLTAGIKKWSSTGGDSVLNGNTHGDNACIRFLVIRGKLAPFDVVLVSILHKSVSDTSMMMFLIFSSYALARVIELEHREQTEASGLGLEVIELKECAEVDVSAQRGMESNAIQPAVFGVNRILG